MNKLKLTDVIDLNYLQEIQDAFSDTTGMAAISVDLKGDVTKPSNFTDFCMKYTRKTELGLKRCLECDLNGGKEADLSGKPEVYYCHSGLIDFAVPVIVQNEHIGSVIGGQVLSEKPDENKFRKIASEIGVNPDEYIEALHKIPIVPESRIRSSAKLLGLVISKLAETYSKRNSLETCFKNIINYTDNVNKILDSFYKKSDSLNSSQTELITEIENINNVLKEINNIVKSVSSIADETQMISFNASIEAARAGEQGKSFTVIGGEIRRLSEQSKKTVSNIQNFTENIQNSITKTSNQSKNCSDSINAEIKDLNLIKENIANIKELLAELSN